MSISLNNIIVKHSERFTLNIPSLSIDSGEIIGVLGSSGSGKSTLLDVISKSIQFEGNLDITSNKIAYLLQDDSLFPNLTVGENILFGRPELKEFEKKKVFKEVCSLVELNLPYFCGVQNLSGGEKKRINLARSLAINPDILLIDEAFNSLDKPLKDKIRNTVKEIISQKGITTIIVSHDLNDLIDIVDRIIIIDQGEIVQIGTFHELCNSPINKYVAELTGKWNWVSNRILSNDSNKDIGIRYDHITLNKGSIEANIINQTFIGKEYLIEIEWNGQILITYHPNPIDSTTINFEIKSFIEF